MKAQLILVPIDFSPTSEAALEAATTLARGSGGKLLIVHAREPQTRVDDLIDLYGYPDITVEELAKKLKAVVPTENGVPYEHQLLDGTPVEAVLKAAESNKVDLIVLGTHGRRGIGRVLMGSVAEAVVRRAKCPVLAIKANAPSTVLTT